MSFSWTIQVSFKLEIWHGLKFTVAHVNFHYEEECGLEKITVVHTNKNIKLL